MPRDYTRQHRLRSATRSLAGHAAACGRVLQPSARHTGAVTQAVTAPFRAPRPGFPNLGTGQVVRARLETGEQPGA